MVRLSTLRGKVFYLFTVLAAMLTICAVFGGHLRAQEAPPEKPPAPPAEPPEQPVEKETPPAEQPEPVELSETAKLEAEARVFEGKGLYSEAVAAYQKALLKAIELAGTATGNEIKKFWAEAEIYLDRAVSLMYQKARPDYKEMARFLEDLGKEHNLSPVMDGWRRWALARVLMRTGEMEKVRETCRGLGFVTNWMIIGPFDNERGQFFDNPYEPETELDYGVGYKGKKRKVHWRLLPVEPVMAEVNFDAMMRPNDEVLAYALAFVEMPEAVDAALRIGSDEGLKVWVNDCEVLSSDIHRTMGFDQDIVGVKLNKGLNKILVKVAERHGSWGFRLRITAPDGGGLQFEVLKTKEEFEKASYDRVEEKAEVAAERGAIGYYEARVSEKPGDHLAQAHFGYLHLVRPFEDENAYKDRKALEKCVELAPQNPYYRFMLAEAYEAEQIRMAAEKEANKARLAVEKAIELEPEYVEALFHQARYYLNDMKNWHKAQKYLDRVLKVNPDYHRAILLKLDILGQRGFRLEERLQTKALEEHPREEIKECPAVLQLLADIYAEEGKPETALKIARAALEHDYTAWWARGRLIRHFISQGEMENALDQYEVMAKVDPYQISNYTARAETYVGMDEIEKAIAEVDRALAVCPEAEDELVQKANLLFRLSLEKGEDSTGEIYARAMALLDKIRKDINPNNNWVRKYLLFLKEEKKSFEDHERLAAEVEYKPNDALYIKSKKLVLDESGQPVVLENGKYKLEEVVQKFLVNDLKQEAEKENLPFLCVLSKTITEVRKDGTSSTFAHVVIRICNELGTQIFRSFPCYLFRGSWSQHEMKVKKARLIHEDGTEEEGQSENWAVNFPPLKVGDVIDVRFRADDELTDLTERFFGDYYGETHLFHTTYYLRSYYFRDVGPIKLSEFYMILPKERKFYFNHLSTETRPVKEPGLDDKTEISVWKLKDLPHIVPEILMPPYDQYLPLVQISSFGDWKEFGKWFYNLVKKQYDISPEMKKKVQELTADKKTEFEKIRAVYNFVVTKIDYRDWEYGIHGWQPYKASTIFARKFGDCKDKALLINTMLREAGIKSLPVLIMGAEIRGEHNMTLPMINHFNHCIAYAPPSEERKEGIWMDGTAEYYGITDGPPCMDWGAPTLVVDEDGGQIIQVPLPDPQKNVQSETRVIELESDGSAKMKTTLTLSGDNAMIARRLLATERRQFNLERRHSRFGGAKIVPDSIKVPDLKDLNLKSLSYSYELKIPDFVKKTPEGLAVQHEFFPVPWSQLTAQTERKYKMALPYMLPIDPIFIPFPGTVRTEQTFVLPKGYGVGSLPEKQKFSSEFADFDILFEKEEGEQPKVYVKKTMTMKKNNLTVDEYKQLRELTSLIEKVQKEKIIIKPPEQPEAPPEGGKKEEKQPPEKPGEEQGK